MENGVSKAKGARDVIISVIASFILYYLGFGEIIFVFPLLLVSSHYGKAASGISIALELALVILYSCLMMGDGDLGLALMLMNLFIPCSLLAAGAVWLVTERQRIGARLILAVIPSALLFAALGFYLGQDRALFGEVFAFYKDVFGAVLSPFINIESLGEEVWNATCYVLFSFVLSILIPVVLCFICATCFTFESVVHSRESDWEDRVGRLELDGRLIWIFLALWLAVLLSRFISIGIVMLIVLFNAAISLTIVYAVQGFSVLYYRMRKKGRRIKSYTLFLILLAIGLFAPGINFIVVLGLPLLGILETFIEFRR